MYLTNQKKIYLSISLLVLIFLFVFPMITTADTVPDKLEAPIKIETITGKEGLTGKIGQIIKTVLGLVGALALVMFIYGGFLWMTSGGKPEQVKKGQDTLVWAVLGLALIFFSYVLVNFIITKLTEENSAATTSTVQEGTELETTNLWIS